MFETLIQSNEMVRPLLPFRSTCPGLVAAPFLDFGMPSAPAG